MEDVKDMTALEMKNQTTTDPVEEMPPFEEKPIDYLAACDLSTVTRRVADGSYVVTRNGMPFHVPDNEEYKDFFAQLDAYVTERPEVVKEEHPYVPTAEELAAQALASAKADRAAAVAAITVEVDGMIFDGDEKAQERMARAVLMADSPDEQTEWVLADNTVALVTADQLKRACRAAGQAQTALWTKPYEA
jgi:hypothetical protein